MGELYLIRRQRDEYIARLEARLAAVKPPLDETADADLAAVDGAQESGA